MVRLTYKYKSLSQILDQNQIDQIDQISQNPSRISDQAEQVYHPQAMQVYTNSKNNQQVDSLDYALYSGIIVYVVYAFLFIYIYGSAYYKNHISKHVTFRKAYTMSEAFQYSEKRGTTILIVLFVGLFQCLFFLQNFYIQDYQRLTVLAANYAILMGWLLLLFVWPNEHKFHSLITLLILISTLYNVVTISGLYHEYYENDELTNMYDIRTFIIVAFCICIFIMSIHTICKIYGIKYLQTINTHIIGLSEIAYIIAYSIFIIIFSTMPPLPNKGDLVCFLK